MQSIGEFLNKLQHVKPAGKDQWTADCPCPTHKTPAKHLSIGLRDNTILLTCFGNDSAEDITHALGLELASLFIKQDVLPPMGVTPKIVATYDYKDEDGKDLFQVVRYEPKSFKQRHKNGEGDWVWNLDGVRRVLYRLQDVCLSNETYLVEGEKDADNLLAWGRIATTSPGGSNAWRPEYADYLKSKRVIIIPDKDAAGYAYAKDIVKSLEGKASSIRVIILSGKAKDISDWLEEGNSVDELTSLEEDISVLFSTGKPKYSLQDDVILWAKQVDDKSLYFRAESVHQERTGIHGRLTIRLDDLNLSWSYLNVEKREERSALATACHSTIKGDLSKLYTRDDLRADLDNFCAGLWDFHVSKFSSELMVGDIEPQHLTFLLKPYILDGGGTILFAPPGRGKSYTALLWGVSVDAGISAFWPVTQTPVLFLNLERSRQSVKRRLSCVNMALGLPPNRPLLTLNARGKSLSDIIASARKDIKKYGIGLIMLDSISRAGFGDLNDNRSVNTIIDALSGLCPTWLALGHTPRQDDTHVFGGVHFDAGADIIVQLASQITDNGTLGVGWQITKQNDLPQFSQQVFAFEFNELGLTAIRRAKPFEFTDIEAKRKQDVLASLIDYVSNQDSGDTTASLASEALGFDRANISRLFSSSGKFVKTRTEGRAQFYGVLS